jgi:hypothetical protein
MNKISASTKLYHCQSKFFYVKIITIEILLTILATSELRM